MAGRVRSAWRETALGVVRSYSQVLFSESVPAGVLLLLATFVVPSVGAVGLAGVLSATALARLLGYDIASVGSGFLGYNALLVFLAVGGLLSVEATFWAVAAAAIGLVVLGHVALSGALSYHLKLPALSLPFVAVSWLLLAAVPHLRGVAWRERLPALDLADVAGPPVMDLFLRSLGAVFFQPHWTAGLLVLVALIVHSRISTVHALVGFAVAWATDRWLVTFPDEVLHLYVGFNFVLTAVALGGVYYVPGPASLVLAAVGALASGLVSVALLQLLAPFGLPVLSAPLCITVLVIVYALRQRSAHSRPYSVEIGRGSPEANLAAHRTWVRRFGGVTAVPLRLPFLGAWTVSQGNDGEHTHQEAWRHGVDFVVATSEGAPHRSAGTTLRDWPCYRLRVLAPAAGVVVRVVDGVPDNPVGEVDTVRPWGNVVILRLGPECYFAAAHLCPGSIPLRTGQTVATGELLGLCGNSGRSPTPHLHVQLQATPDLGAPTLPIAFREVVTGEGRLRADHLPAEGEVVREVAPADELVAALRWTPGMRQRFRLTEGNKPPREVSVRCELDLLGRWSLVDDAGAKLSFAPGTDAWNAVDLTGRSAVLRTLAVALAKVPLDRARELEWTVGLDPSLVDPSAWRALREVLAAVWSWPTTEVDYRWRRHRDEVVVEGKAERLGLRTEARIGPEGVRAAVLEQRGVRVELAAIGERG
ncbi:MAG: urea transporter [Myxococcota bacterium]|jgi:urea transporter